MNSGTARTPPPTRARLSTAGTAPGSIIAAIIATHTAMNDANEPSLVATPMSIPRICQTEMPQQAAASPSVAVSAAAIAAVLTGATVVTWSVMISSGSLSGAGGPRIAPVEVVLQRLERAVPVAGQRGQELLCYLHGSRSQPVPHPAPLPPFGRDQAGLGQQAQVLGDRLPGDRQGVCEVGGRGRAIRGQRGQDGAPGRVGQRSEYLLGNRLDVSRHRGRRPARQAPSPNPRSFRRRPGGRPRRAAARTRSRSRSAGCPPRPARG